MPNWISTLLKFDNIIIQKVGYQKHYSYTFFKVTLYPIERQIFIFHFLNLFLDNAKTARIIIISKQRAENLK